MNIPTGKTYHRHCRKLIFCTMCSHVLNYLFSSIYIDSRSPLTSQCSSTSPSSLHERRHAAIKMWAPDSRTRVLIVIALYYLSITVIIVCTAHWNTRHHSAIALSPLSLSSLFSFSLSLSGLSALSPLSISTRLKIVPLGLDFAVEEESEARWKVDQQEKRLRLESRVNTIQYTTRQ
jgi:hypothetical protein